MVLILNDQYVEDEWNDFMLSKTQIFKEIVQIMRKDYARYVEKEHVNKPENHFITEEMSDKYFVETVQSYLLDFKDGH